MPSFRLRKSGGGSTLRGGDTLRGPDAKYFTASGASTSSGSVVFSRSAPYFSASGLSLSDGSVVFKRIRVASFSGGSVSSGSVVFERVYTYITPVEVDSTMTASIRQATPTTPDPDSQFLRLDGTVAALVRSLVDLELPVPIGVGAIVLQGTLRLYKAEAWPSGSHSVTVEAIADTWEGSTATWSTQPTVRTPPVVVSVAGSGDAGDVIEINVTDLLAAAVAADDASGERWYGLRISIATAGEKRLFSALAAPDLRPRLVAEYSLPPEAPQDLLPNAARAVSEVKPELVSRFVDQDAEDVLAFLQVQIDDSDTFDTVAPAALLYDSGKVSHDRSRFDLAAPPSGAPATPTLPLNTDLWWREKVWDNHGVESPWSAAAKFRVTAKGTLVLDSPSGSVVSSPTPAISWTFAAQAYREVEISRLEAGAWVTHWLLPKHESTSTAVAVPNDYRLAEDETYLIAVRGWDTVDREDMAGDRSFLEVTRQVTLAPLSV